MKKVVLKSALLTALISSSLMGAENSGLYVGIGFTTGSGTLTTEGNSDGATREDDYDSTSLPLKIGYIFTSGNRFELSYEREKQSFSKDDILGRKTEYSTGVNLDWKFVYQYNKLRPYFGFGFGLYHLEDTAKYFTDNEDLKGVSGNFEIGTLYPISDVIEIEANFRVKSIVWQDVQDGSEIYSSDSTGGNLYLGANYKF